MKIGLEIEHVMMKEGSSSPVPMSGLTDYTKASPLVIEGVGTIHPDGALFEFALDPAESGEEAWDKYLALKEIATDILEGDGWEFLTRSAMNYLPADLHTHRGNSEFGCDRSFNVNPFVPHVSRYIGGGRYGGVHVNIDYSGNDIEEMVKRLDYFVGLHATAEWRTTGDASRREYYGRAGEYRLPEFGIEYRTLGASMWSHDSLIELWDRVAMAYDASQEKTDSIIENYESIVEVINNNSRMEAIDLLEAV